MKLDELLQRVPPRLRPLAARYAPALVEMTAEQLADWVSLLLAGRSDEAWRAVLSHLDEADLAAAWDETAERWDRANHENARRLALQKDAAAAVLKVLLAAALGAVGL